LNDTASSPEAFSAAVQSRMAKVVVASTVMLSFITFWRAAAIVLCDLASSAFYAGGITEGYVGKSAPWFVFAIMLFSYAVRAVYVESCSMFVRGGVYRVVSEALGTTLAKFSVSALIFDYILTGPISGVTAGLYLSGLINDLAKSWQHPQYQVNPPLFAAMFTIAVIGYFWRKNVIGMHESSHKALRIMQLTTLMAVILIVWCLVTIFQRGYQPVPLPTLSTIKFSEDALGWLHGTFWPSFTAVAVIIGLGHSLLAMSGEESLAQVHREIASPKLKNLKRAGLVIFIYSLLFTSLVSFFAVMIIPDQERVNVYLGNLVSGLAMNMVGPLPLRLLFQGFVVLIGTVILAGAVNTAIVGSNGVMNRVAEDGVLPAWFRKPHSRFGTTYRLIAFISLLQIVTVVLTRGDMMLLGDAYAFGVVWSFTMMSLSMLVLRYKKPEEREWKVPLNFSVRGVEIPVGLSVTALVLLTLAIANLFTKKVATVWGFGFTVVIFLAFEATEFYNRRKKAAGDANHEQFTLVTAQELSGESLKVRSGNVLVPVRNPYRLDHLKRVLDKTDTTKMDIVVMTVRTLKEGDEVFDTSVIELFSKVVSLAEKAGKTVSLTAVSGDEPNDAVVQTAQRLGSSSVVIGVSGKMQPALQAKQFGDSWEKLPQPRPQLSLEIVDPDHPDRLFFNLGPHPPRLWPQDVDLLHELWLKLIPANPGLRHRDVVHMALRKLDSEIRK